MLFKKKKGTTLWINSFVTFMGRFVTIECLIYSHNMPEKYYLFHLPICCNVNSLFFRRIVRLYQTLDTCKPSRECNEQIDPKMNIIG